MTASAAARRRGFAATGPPSWKISSMQVSFFRTTTSGMHQAPFLKRGGYYAWIAHSDDSRLSSQMKRSGTNQADFEQAQCSPLASRERLVDFRGIQVADGLRNQQFAQVAVGCKLMCRNSHHRRVSRQIDCVSDDGCRGVGCGGTIREHRDRVGDA